MKLLLKKHKKSILIFILISLFLYTTYYLAFRKFDIIVENFFLNLAFLPIYVLFTTFILEELLSMREKPLLYRKRNTTIGLFYSEMGTTLLKELSMVNKNTLSFCPKLLVSQQWTRLEFSEARTFSGKIEFELVKNDLEGLMSFLKSNREVMLSLLQNPILAEDRSFNNLILSVFHLMQELIQRSSQGELTPEDYTHLAIDIKRVYTSLIIEWLNYMEHISLNYPHLFSLEVRVNPFKELADSNKQCDMSA